MTIMQIPKETETLRTHNAWRKGNDDTIEMGDPTELGIAIDTVLESHADMLDEIEALRKQCHESVKAAATIVEHVSAGTERKVKLTLHEHPESGPFYDVGEVMAALRAAGIEVENE